MVVITIAPKSDNDNGDCIDDCGDEGIGGTAVGSGLAVANANGDPKSSSVVTTSGTDTVTVTPGIQGKIEDAVLKIRKLCGRCNVFPIISGVTRPRAQRWPGRENTQPFPPILWGKRYISKRN